MGPVCFASRVVANIALDGMWDVWKLAGRDASRGMAKQSFDDCNVHNSFSDNNQQHQLYLSPHSRLLTSQCIYVLSRLSARTYHYLRPGLLANPRSNKSKVVASAANRIGVLSVAFLSVYGVVMT